MKYNETEFFKFEKSAAIFLNSVVDYLLLELKEGSYTASINFVFPHRNDHKQLKIEIEEILAVNINQTAQGIGQQIHNYKFLMHNEYYYLSLDPDESSMEVSEEDQDFFLFKKLTALF